ncbi:MAG: biotin/lipoyl-containing protein, partial [Thermoleophilaceae bacterium]
MEAGTTVQITMPQMGDSVTEGTVLEWLKQVGDTVEPNEALLEVSTDKVDAEVPAPVGGTLVRILVQADETVPVGTVLGEIDTDGGSPPPDPDTDTGQIDGDHRGDESGADMSDPAATEMAHVAAKNQAEQATGDLVDVVLPQMGESVQEGTVLEWHKQVGDQVAEGETLVEISTDKVDAEIPAPVAGVVAAILAEPDETVQSGTIVARIQPGATAAEGSDPISAPDSGGQTPSVGATEISNGEANATPVAVRIADAHGLDLAGVQGSGRGGKVLKGDVLALVDGNGGAPQAPEAPAPAEMPPPGARPIRGPAATLARFMNESRTIPTATSFRTLSVSMLDSRRRALKGAGQKLSFTHLIAWAIVQAAREMHVMTNAYAEAEGKPQRIVPDGVSIGLAVDVERKDGTRSLIVPVIEQADRLDFPSFAARYDELVVGARDNTLPPDAYTGANITLTNPGGIGTVASVPRLMPGQGTIVATGAIGYPPGMTNVDPAQLAELG